MRARPFRVLLLEDNDDDAALVTRALRGGSNGLGIERATDEASFRDALEDHLGFDIVLSDWHLPRFDALRALEIAGALAPDVPFVIVSGAVGEDAAVAAMRAGARDYVLKDRLGRLLPVVEREVREYHERRTRAATEAALEKSEHRYRSIVETTSQGVWLIDADRKTTFVNARMAAMLRMRADDLYGRSPKDFVVDWRETPVADVVSRFYSGKPQHAEVVYRRADGTTFLASVESTPIVDRHGVFEGGIAHVTDISSRRAAEQALEARDAEIHDRLRGEALLADVGIALTEGTSLHDTLMRCARALVLHADAALARVWLLDSTKTALELVASAGLTQRLDIPHQRVPIGKMVVGKIAQSGRAFVSDDFPKEPDCGDPERAQSERLIGFAGQPLVVRGEVLGVIAMFGHIPFRAVTLQSLRNISGAVALGVRQKLEEQAKIEIENQLRHAQKMEAVGRLAGGIAHDFNNLLSVIANYAQVIEEEAPNASALREDAHEIVEAACRATALTRQLLLFSRRQIRETRVIALDDLIASLDKMLRRLVGEDVTIDLQSGAADARVRVDPGSIEQVVMNLVVNARDAMPNGGRVTLRTIALDVDEARATELGILPGRHAVLWVADTGTGIDADTRLKIFDPYFTTKDISKGTGLGLSMVRGIVQEAGGTVTLDTEVGRGSTFGVYLPCVDEEKPKTTQAAAVPRAEVSATVLLVEDEPLVRSTARRLLERKGYRVIEAEDAEQAITIASSGTTPFDLLLTDVVMPGMSGPELARALLPKRPDLRVVFMSGYAEDNLVQHGTPAETQTWLRKPFTIDTLVTKVRDALT